MLRVIKPLAITDAELIASTVDETEAGMYAAWSPVTNYSIGNRVLYQHQVFEALQSGNTNHTPGAVGSTWWLYLGHTNRWAMFDGAVNTSTTAPLLAEVVLQFSEFVSAIGVVAFVGSSVTVTVRSAGNVVYTQTLSVGGSSSSGWYEYFFDDSESSGDLLFDGLPPYLGAQITVTMVGSSTVSCGVLVAGKLYEIGGVHYGAEAGIAAYSRQTTDDFGITTLLRRPSARKVTMQVDVPRENFRRVNEIMTALESTPCFWVGDEDTDELGPLVVFGWYRDFRQVVTYPRLTTMALELQGFI